MHTKHTVGVASSFILLLEFGDFVVADESVERSLDLCGWLSVSFANARQAPQDKAKLRNYSETAKSSAAFLHHSQDTKPQFSRRAQRRAGLAAVKTHKKRNNSLPLTLLCLFLLYLCTLNAHQTTVLCAGTSRCPEAVGRQRLFRISAKEAQSLCEKSSIFQQKRFQSFCKRGKCNRLKMADADSARGNEMPLAFSSAGCSALHNRSHYVTMKKITLLLALFATLCCCTKRGKFHITGCITGAADTMLYLEHLTLSEGAVAVDSVRLAEGGDEEASRGTPSPPLSSIGSALAHSASTLPSTAPRRCMWTLASTACRSATR